MATTVKAPKIKWVLSPTSTRAWPTADYLMPDGSTKAALRIDADGTGHKAEYSHVRAKSGDHIPLTVCIAAYDATNGWEWRKLKQRFLSLEKAKAGGEMAIISYQEFWPLELRPAPKVVEVKPRPPTKPRAKK